MSLWTKAYPSRPASRVFAGEFVDVGVDVDLNGDMDIDGVATVCNLSFRLRSRHRQSSRPGQGLCQHCAYWDRLLMPKVPNPGKEHG